MLRVLFSIEHALQDAGVTRAGDRRVVSKRVLYVDLDNDGVTRHLHYAPDLDYRPLADDEPTMDAFLERPECAWIGRDAYRTLDTTNRLLTAVSAPQTADVEKLKMELLRGRYDEQARGEAAARFSPSTVSPLTVESKPCRRWKNCIIALEENEPAAQHLRRIVYSATEQKLRLRVVAISASERKPDGTDSEDFCDFTAKIARVGLEDVEIRTC